MSVGKQLSDARCAAGLSVVDLSDRTKIRPSIIESMERDDFAPCGGEAYARGHLRACARALGIDEGVLLAEFDGKAGGELPVTPFPPPGDVRGTSPRVVILVALLIALIVVGAWLLAS